MSSSNCCFLVCIQVSQEADQVVWYSHLFQNFPQFIVVHTVKDFGIVNKAEVDVFLELSCFFNDPAGAGNLISASSAFSKSSLNIWKFTVYILLKPGLENFEHYFAIVWDECHCAVVLTFFGMPFFEIGKRTDLFQACGHWWVFQICLHIECSSFTASSFRIWNSSTGITSPPLALLWWCFLMPTWLRLLEFLALGEWSQDCGYLGHEDLFCFSQVYTISVLYCAHLCMKCSLGISGFLKEISSLSHSVVFFYFFALIAEEGFLIYPCYSLQFYFSLSLQFFVLVAQFEENFDSYRWAIKNLRFTQ